MSSTKPSLTPQERCRVCGWILPSKMESPHSICACCGTQRGYEDLSIESVQERRRRWIEDGMKWFDDSEKPGNWSAEEQLAHVNDVFEVD